MEEWSTQRWGDAQEHVGENFSREEFLEEGYVAESRGGAREGDAHHVMNMRTPSPGADASSRTPSPGARPPVPDRGSILGTYRDTPVEWIDRSVKPSGSYLVIDGVSGGRRQPPTVFRTWYGFYGAERYMGVGTTARSFAWITGDDMPQHRAEDMRIALLRQSESRGTPAHEAVREQYDLWGNQEPASLLREPNDSADTEYHSDLFVTARMADRWLEIQQLQSDKICWDATYGPNTQGSSHLSKDCDGKPWKVWMGEEPIGHPSNAAREKAWRNLEQDLAIPDYASDDKGITRCSTLLPIRGSAGMPSSLSGYLPLTGKEQPGMTRLVLSALSLRRAIYRSRKARDPELRRLDSKRSKKLIPLKKT